MGPRSHLWQELLRTGAIVVLTLIAACNPQRTQELYSRLEGPRPELDSADIEGFVERQTSAVANLVTLAGLKDPPPSGSAEWQTVVEAGTVYVDRVCDEYIGALFWFDRWRDSAKSGLALTGAATAAAMGIIGVSVEALALTATAFGLATGLIDTGATTVLYSIEPSAVRTALERSQAVYRNEIAMRRELYVNQAAALAAVQGYLALCLPATLETTINNAVTQADIRATVTDPNNPVPTVGVQPFDVRAALPETPPVPPALQIVGALSADEQALSRAQGGLIQEALCVRPDGNFGADTREAIALYRRAIDDRGAADSRLQQPLSQREITSLLGVGPCASRLGYRTAYERFDFPTEESIRALQTQITELPGGPRLQITGRFDDATRAAIRELRQRLGLGDADTVTPELLNAIAA